MTTTTKPNHKLPRGEATLSRILDEAVHIASVEGIDALSLGTLAKATNMSKSGLFAHFQSKDALQQAIFDRAEEMFRDEVFSPALAVAPGSQRVEALVLRYVEWSGKLFRGGCFFAAAAHELDGRKELLALRERVVAFYDRLREVVHGVVIEAIAEGTFRRDVDVEEFWFSLQSIALATNFDAQLRARPERALRLGTTQARQLLDRTAVAPAE